MSYLLKTRTGATDQEPASSEEQQEKINEVRGLLGDLPAEMPSFLSDRTIRRFLRARNWSMEQAAKGLKETVKWRREYRPETIRWDDITENENEARRAYIAEYLDKNGRSVLASKPTIKTKVSAKEQIKYLVYLLENLATNSADEKDDGVVWLNDFRGWSLSATPLSTSRESLHIIQNYYPGLIAVAIPCNPPRIFESFWKAALMVEDLFDPRVPNKALEVLDNCLLEAPIINYFIEPRMKEKVKFVYTSNPESQKIIADMFDLDKLESTFGGRNTAAFDMDKYAERMRSGDQMKGASTHASMLMTKPNHPEHD